MKEDKLSILEELYEDSLQDQKILNDGLKKNLDRIEEINVFIDSIRNSEESDFKVFSPRSVESLYKEKIDNNRDEIRKLELENEDYHQKLNKLEKQLDNIVYLIKENQSVDERMHLAILDIQEKERVRISRELHDSSLQGLAHLVHMLELSSMFIDQDSVRAKLDLSSCSQNLKQIINEIRDTIFNLRPMSFDDLGFKQCMENFAEDIKQQYFNCEFIYKIDEISYDLIDQDKRDVFTLFLVTVYRIIQESVINAMKHSDADRIELFIKKEEKSVLIDVNDNGKGFVLDDVLNIKDNKHFGICVLYERIYLLGGKIKIDSRLHYGTKINISVPLPLKAN